MQNFKHKVQSQSGASMLMALFLLLVVTVVSVVILVSATSAAHQVRDNRAAQQAYLTVSSAADLLVQAFAKQSYTYTLTTYTRSDDHKITRTDEKKSTSESVLQETLLAASHAVCQHNDNGTPSELVFSRNAKLSLTNAEEKMQPVQAEFRLSCQSSGSESRYEMLVRLSLADTADTAETEPSYRMELRIPISKTQTVESRGSITEGTAAGTPITWEVTDSITAVVWQQARMTKGWQDAKA